MGGKITYVCGNGYDHEFNQAVRRLYRQGLLTDEEVRRIYGQITDGGWE